MKEIRITEHAYMRMKERNGWGKKAAGRMATKIYETGEDMMNSTGYMRRLIRSKVRKTGGRYILYGNNVYVYREKALITTYPMPHLLTA